METWLGAFGILATVIVGIAAVVATIVWASRRRYPGRLTFVKEQYIGLYDAIVRNLPRLSVLYDSNPISEHLVLVKGYFLNTGSTDITRQMQEVGPLTMILPQGYKWLDRKIVSSSPGVGADASISNDVNLVFDLTLFRVDEYIRFEALAEVPSGQNATGSGDTERRYNPAGKLQKAMQLTHRIPNTQQVQPRPLPPRSGVQDLLGSFGYSLPFFVIFGVGLLAFFSISLSSIPSHVVRYATTTDDNRTVDVYITPKPDGSLKVEAVDGSFSRESKLDDFFAGCKCQPSIVPDPGLKLVMWLAIGFLCFSGLGGVGFIFMLAQGSFKFRENSKLRKLLPMDS